MVYWVIILRHLFPAFKDAKIDYFKDVMIICVTIFNHFTRGDCGYHDRNIGGAESKSQTWKIAIKTPLNRLFTAEEFIVTNFVAFKSLTSGII